MRRRERWILGTLQWGLGKTIPQQLQGSAKPKIAFQSLQLTASLDYRSLEPITQTCKAQWCSPLTTVPGFGHTVSKELLLVDWFVAVVQLFRKHAKDAG